MAGNSVKQALDESLQSALQVLKSELNEWQDIGKTATFWWRDDDACHPAASLAQLLKISDKHQVPLALAAIPRGLDRRVINSIASTSTVTVLQHGYSHINYAPENQKKMELGLARPLDIVCTELQEGRKVLQKEFDKQFHPVLVPPWNRIANEIIQELPQLGFDGYSVFGVVGSNQTHDNTSNEKRIQQVADAQTLFVQANVHVDIIDWRNTRRTFPFDEIVAQIVVHLQARRSGNASIDEATGFMTHHLVHDEQAWAFINGLFDCCHQYQSVKWLDSRAVFKHQV